MAGKNIFESLDGSTADEGGNVFEQLDAPREVLPGEAARFEDPTRVGRNLEVYHPSQKDAGEPLKPTFQAIGGTIGSVLGGAGGAIMGVPGGPPGMGAGGIGGALLGDTVGTAGGTAAYNLYRDVARKFTNDESVPPSTSERLIDPWKEGLTSGIISGGVGALPGRIGAGFNALRRNWLRVTPESAQLAAEGKSHGIDLGVTDVTEGKIPGMIQRTIGQVPLLGTPVRTAHEAKVGQVTAALGRELDALGPSRDAAALGSEMAQKAEATFGKFIQGEVQPAYESVAKLAAQEGAIIPSAKLVNAAHVAEFELQKSKPTLTTGEEMSGVLPEYIKKFLGEAQELPSHLSADNLRWIKQNLDDLMAKADKDGFQWKQAHSLREAVEETLKDNAATSPAAKALLDADELFHNGMTKFENATGKKFTQVDKNMFRKGFEKPGSVNEDELMRTAMNLRSPKAVEDLEGLVGKDTMSRLTRRYMEDAATSTQRAVEGGEKVFDPSAFAAKLHLDNPQSAEFKAFERAYNSAGGDMDKLQSFVKIAKIVMENAPPSANQFMARRAALGGISAGTLVGGGALGSAMVGPGTGLAVPLATLLAGRHVSKLISDPKKLDLLLKAWEPTGTSYQKRMAGVRLMRSLEREHGENALVAQDQDERMRRTPVVPTLAGTNNELLGAP